jgi:hypothetical protein
MAPPETEHSVIEVHRFGAEDSPIPKSLIDMITSDSVLKHIVNLTPATLRKMIYANETGFTHRSQVGRTYRTRGDLVVTVFNLYSEGKLEFLKKAFS